MTSHPNVLFHKVSFYLPCWSAQWPVQCSGQYQWQMHFCPQSWCQSLPRNKQKASEISPWSVNLISYFKYWNAFVLMHKGLYLVHDGGWWGFDAWLLVWEGKLLQQVHIGQSIFQSYCGRHHSRLKIEKWWDKNTGYIQVSIQLVLLKNIVCM